MNTTITLRAKSEEKDLIVEYAKMHGMSLSSFMLGAALDRIEDEVGLRELNEAIKEYETNPVTISHQELKRELGL